jgi:hypothetical protein
MAMEPLDGIAAPDRFATTDEIRAALWTLREIHVGSVENSLWEVASDAGGLVLLEAEDVEALSLVDEIGATAN